MKAREWRGRIGAWPRWVRVLVAVGSGLAVIAGAVIVRDASASPPRHFPGQYAFSGFYDYPTTVSVDQALHDHGFALPHGIREMRYAADSPGYSWPYAFVAVFSFPCSEIGGFVEASNLRYGGSGQDWPAPDVDVLLFAQAQGWHAATGKPARWYYRAVPQTASVYEEVLIVGRTMCTVYLTNNN